MKFQMLLFLLAFSGILPVTAQLAADTDTALVSMKETQHHFGKIPQGRPVTHDFIVTNNGRQPLIIDRVEATCGCTSPVWSDEPVAPGASTAVKVGFNAAAEGPFSKNISIIYNNNQVKTLVISGDVYPRPATSAPLNPSLTYIKQLK